MIRNFNSESRFSNKLNRRVKIIFFSVILSFLFLTIRAFHIQIIKGPGYEEKAKKLHKLKILLYPRRGNIYDRNMKELALTIKVPSIFLRPHEVENKSEVVEFLYRKLSIPRKKGWEMVESKSPFLWVKRYAGEKEGEIVERSNMKGMGILWEYKRIYPMGTLAAHILGFAGADTKGLEGIELKYDEVLQKKPVELIVNQDARREEIFTDVDDYFKNSTGNSIIITIDGEIQAHLEEELKRGCEENRAKECMGIFTNPHTGEIIAGAIYPSFNPNDFLSFPPERWKNKIVTDIIEPGSIFKVFLIAAILEENLYSPNQILYCENGAFRFFDRIISDYKPFGFLTLEETLIYSSNICAGKMALTLGAERFYEYIRGFGFGEKTGIDLPSESVGLLRPPSAWYPVDLFTAGFGQGIGVTPIQLITAFNAAINGGYLLRPYLVKEIRGPENSTLQKTRVFFKKRVISEETSRKLREILIRVVEEGTGKNAKIEGYEVGGKTGTAQKYDPEKKEYSKEKFYSAFVGFFPVKYPRFSGLIILNEPEKDVLGGIVAAPVFKNVANFILKKYEIPSEINISKEVNNQ